MGKSLAQQFVFHLIVTTLIAHVAASTLPAGAEYLQVFRVTGTVGFLAYAAALAPGAIWHGRPWGPVVKEMMDGLVWGLLTAGVFGWMWPS